ncbi:hypothetical protein A8B82_12925 [Sulfitobacter sp. EhC04]|uniref:hypothetical protein n=1 Tax=Sulfitobacter sp. EhC04 TaxID=1849168 RepID=UPI0007F3803D|nr:hypothetical protein [Sulfitobacter sp. EhC04]OAN77499.1 hypothetical protein A8B82_12925 [Sulfitobacter sp. EhC04]
MAKRVSTRKIKKHRLYGYDEAGGALGVTPHTVRDWRASGLEVMAATTPHYILGAELIRYIEDKQAKRSVKMALDQMYCLKCKAPRKPLWGMVDYIPTNDARGRLMGLCEACEGGLQRFVGKGDLGRFGQIYEITNKGVS